MYIAENEYTLEGLNVRHKIVWPNDKLHSNENLFDVYIQCNDGHGKFITITMTQNEWTALKRTIELGRSL